MKSLSRVRLFVTLWPVAHQAPLCMGFSRQEYWSGLPFPSPGDLPDPGIEPWSLTLQGDTLPSEAAGKPSMRVEFFKIHSESHCFKIIMDLSRCDNTDVTRINSTILHGDRTTEELQRPEITGQADCEGARGPQTLLLRRR